MATKAINITTKIGNHSSNHLNQKKEIFLNDFPRYGYNGEIDDLRKREFSHLNAGGVYLDHAGATIPSQTQLDNCFKLYQSTIFANPHSNNDVSQNTREIVQMARQDILAWLNTTNEEYIVIFTSNSTHSLKILGESFPWNSGSEFCYTIDNHTSVLGMREYALQKGARISTVYNNNEHTLTCCCNGLFERDIFNDSSSGIDIDIDCVCRYKQPITASAVKEPSSKDVYDNTNKTDVICSSSPPYHLFAFPGESNFNGYKYDLMSVISRVRSGNIGHSNTGEWKILCDAAKLAATTPINLSEYPIDFLVLSFYKLFGYPTGLGALVVRKDSASLLKKVYFGGGTVEAVLSTSNYHRNREDIIDCFEDGTISYMSIAALQYGFACFNALGGMKSIQDHIESLSCFTFRELKKLKHYNNKNLIKFYGRNICCPINGNGSSLTFNLIRSSGEFIGHNDVERLASNVSSPSIQLRTGCFCNPGACQYYLNLTSKEIKDNHKAGHKCWDQVDIVNGKPIGAIRLSIGYMTAYEDIIIFIEFLRKYFLNLIHHTTPVVHNKISASSFTNTSCILSTDNIGIIDEINLYPIKSCGTFVVNSWPIGDRGLLFDREWGVFDTEGLALSQRRVPKMCLIHPTIDLITRKLHVTAPNMTPLEIPLDTMITNQKEEEKQNIQNLKICGEKCNTIIYPSHINEWFSTALSRPCRLGRVFSSRKVSSRLSTTLSKEKTYEKHIGFANEAQYLLCNLSSVSAINDIFVAADPSSKLSITHVRFRPNLIFRGLPAFIEDSWKSIVISSSLKNTSYRFDAIGLCQRCPMVNVDPDSGETDPSLLHILSDARRDDGGKIMFGLLLTGLNSLDDDGDTTHIIHVGDIIKGESGN